MNTWDPDRDPDRTPHTRLTRRGENVLGIILLVLTVLAYALDGTWT